MSAARRTSRCNPRRPNLQPWAEARQRHREERMSHIDPQVDPEVLADIRRAAFELRQTDPQEAVRLLRRAAAPGGGAEVLARGALGEIYLDEFGDLDGAEHELRTVLHAVPDLHAAQLRQLLGRPEEAARALAQAEESGQLPAREAAALRRDALEEAGEVEDAAAQARRVVELDSRSDEAAGGPAAIDVLRAAALTAVAGDESAAAEMLKRALARAEAELPVAPANRRAGLEDAVRRYRDALASDPGALISLRVKK